MKLIVEAFEAASLYLKPEKCFFHQNHVKYVKLIISDFSIEIGPKNVEAVTE
jgi:hypothetical protein